MEENLFQERLGRLETTKNSVERNSLALELSETCRIEVFELLLNLINRIEIVNSRGALVFCLKNFDCSSCIDLLVELIGSGNWEVAHEAFLRLSSIEHVEGDQVSRAYALLKTFASKSDNDDWRINLIKDAISFLINLYDSTDSDGADSYVGCRKFIERSDSGWNFIGARSNSSRITYCRRCQFCC